jgi:competence protein ComEA
MPKSVLFRFLSLLYALPARRKRALNMDERSIKQGTKERVMQRITMQGARAQRIRNGLLALSLALSASFFSGQSAAIPNGQPVVNINTADAQTIADGLNGIGIKKAEAIIEYRKEHGPFKTLEDLKSVKGIGDATVANNEKLIQLD